MKHVKKKLLIFVLILILIFSIGFSLNTLLTSFEVRRCDTQLSYTYSEITVRINSEDKISFAKEKDELYKQALEDGIIKKIAEEDLSDMIENSTFQQESLENYGVYLLPTSVETVNVSENVSLSKPVVFYNAGDKTWIITYSGSWMNDKWNQSIRNGPLGKKDTYGIRYTDISGTCDAVVKSVFAYITDEEGNRIKTTTNRSGINDGFCFEFEDYMYGILKKSYVGYKWYGSCVYDSNWKNFSSYVCAYHDPH